MGLAELLGLVTHQSTSQQAWEQLSVKLKSTLSADAASWRLQDADFEDILQTMMEKLASQGVHALVGKSEGECREYLRTMFRHMAILRDRKGKREVMVDSVPDVEVRPVSEERVELKQAGELLERVYQAYRQKRRPDHLPELEKDWAELSGLLSGELDMESILLGRERLALGASIAEKEKAAQRVYKRHGRLRDHLTTMARWLEEKGCLSSDELKQVIQLSAWMKRNQKEGTT
ncbi:hypothetical protein D7V97_11835 [Corallococcus sp. CA053C]|uniref:hypothetical protein n=1 Tax=Corallococcus sp. CA053C TaxID=2316732 RepID=UPI000EA25B0A|nr:hypothetical protein [Corallococcus sp. CA053C]RKH11168.1 hypothetical protein D7V97_11835 [Corallococcus sp. CA053C]